MGRSDDMAMGRCLLSSRRRLTFQRVNGHGCCTELSMCAAMACDLRRRLRALQRTEGVGELAEGARAVGTDMSFEDVCDRRWGEGQVVVLVVVGSMVVGSMELCSVVSM
jgi:hypothetical protein